MSDRDLTLTTEDRHSLDATLFEPRQSNGIAVQINSALATPRQYYKHFAGFLSEQGFTVLTYDYRGLPKPWKAHTEEKSTITDWGELDQPAATQWLKEHYPDHNIVLVAHSLGGQIIGLNCHAADFRAILMYTSAQGYWRRFPGVLQRLHQLLMWQIAVPVLIRLLGYLPGKYVGMFDLPANAARQLKRFCFNPHWLCDEAGNAYRPFNSEIRVPLRHTLFSDDEVVPLQMQIDMTSFYPKALSAVEIKEAADYGMEKVGHFGFFRKTMARSGWQDAADWLRHTTDQHQE